MSAKRKIWRRRAPLCKGYTQKGRRCQRPIKHPYGYCHDHLPRNWSFGKSYKVQVKKIIDGDTFIVENQRIRPIGYDTPEKNEQGFLDAKNDFESIIPPGTKVDISPIIKDKYGRTVAQVKKDGEELSKLMEEKGWKKQKKKKIRMNNYHN